MGQVGPLDTRHRLEDDGSVNGMVRYGRGREEIRKFEAIRALDGRTKSEISPEKIREMWEDMVSENH